MAPIAVFGNFSLFRGFMIAASRVGCISVTAAGMSQVTFWLDFFLVFALQSKIRSAVLLLWCTTCLFVRMMFWFMAFPDPVLRGVSFFVCEFQSKAMTW